MIIEKHQCQITPLFEPYQLVILVQNEEDQNALLQLNLRWTADTEEAFNKLCTAINGKSK
jgi:hypothetical protein